MSNLKAARKYLAIIDKRLRRYPARVRSFDGFLSVGKRDVELAKDPVNFIFYSLADGAETTDYADCFRFLIALSEIVESIGPFKP